MHVSTTRWDFPPCPRQILWFLVWAFLVVAPAPFFLCFAVSPAGETQIWPGDLRVVAAVFGFLLVFDLPRDYGTKVFHDVFNLFTRFSQC